MKNKSLTFALFNFFYAIFYAAVQLSFLNTPSKGRIFQSVRDSYFLPFIPNSVWNVEGRGVSLETVRSPAQLHRWLSTVFVNVTYREQSRVAVAPSSWYNTSIPVATINSFNRVLLFRFSVKRWKSQKNTRGKFSQMYPVIFEPGSSPELDTGQVNENENRSTHFGFEWQGDGGFDDAGGYVIFVDPLNGQAAFEDQLRNMTPLFDRWMGSVAIDMMLYNPNEDAFMYMAIILTFDLAGNCRVYSRAQGFDFRSFVQDDDVMCAMHVLMTLFLAWLLMAEFKSMFALTIPVYFRRYASWMIISSILLCCASIVSYWVLREEAQDMGFEFAQLAGTGNMPSVRGPVFLELVHLSNGIKIHENLAAFCIFISFLRAVFLIGGLQSNLGLILKVLEVTWNNLFTFFIMFLEIILGFVFFGFFVFGTKLQRFGSIERGLYTCFAMFTGKSNLQELQSADPLMAPLFYYLFYISFYFIAKNLFISILMSGYDIVDYEIKRTTKEPNPAQLLYKDIKEEVYDPAMNYGSMTANVGSSAMSSLKNSFLECLGVCGMRLGGRERAPSKYGDEDPKTKQAVEHTGGQDVSERGPPPHHSRFDLVQFIRIVIFMVTVLVFIFISRYGKASYDLSRATLFEILDRTDFSDVRSFEDVQPWATRTLEYLYGDVVCADYSSYPSTFNRSSAACDHTLGSRQQVQHVRASTGFLKTTFARLTVGPACFIQNPDEHLRSGGPLVRITPDRECASSRACQVDLFENRATCHTPEGVSLRRDNINNINVPGTSLTYNYSMPRTDLGAALQNGGFVFNFGSSHASAMAAMDLAARGNWFTWKSASMVFDWLTYNGNSDLFTHSRVEYSLMSTGKMEAKASAITFTLNEYVGGGPFRSGRRALMGFLILYVIQVSVYIIELITTLVLQSMRDKKSCREIGYLFVTDVWMLVDTLSLSISITVMVSYFHLYGMTFRAFDDGFRFADYHPNIPQDLVVPTNVTRARADDLYIFFAFEDFGGSVSIFRTLSALNSFFISFKVIKYVNSWESVKVFSSTLATGAERMFYFLIMLVLLLVGCAMFISTFFGQAVPRVQDPSVAMLELFAWILGEFDLEPFIEINSVIAITYFILYMMFVYFIYSNIFLATMLNTYSEKVGERDIAAAHKEMIMKCRIIIVEYESIEDMDKDIELDRKDPLTEVKALKGDKAKSLGVDVHFVLHKINSDEEFGRYTEILPDPMTNRITLRFAPPQNTRCRIPFMHKEEENKCPPMPPTVQNFWGRWGAYAWVRQQAEGKALQPEEGQSLRRARFETDATPAPAELVDERPTDAAGLSSEDTEKDIKKETKETLERILFSRWMDGACQLDGRDGSGGKDMAWETRRPVLSQLSQDNGTNSEERHGRLDKEDEFFKYDWSRVDKDTLRDEMRPLRVSGHEMWLDVLMAAIEREMEDGSIVTSVLGTSEMYDKNAKHAKEPNTEKQIKLFYQRAFQIFRLLEYTAFKKYYLYLHYESEEYQEHLKNQNHVLNDYVCELEKKFTQIMQDIHKDRAKKDAMLTTLKGLMENTSKHTDKSKHRLQEEDDRG